MKLANYLTLRLSFLFSLILLIWSVIYFFIQMKEIYDGIDEGLNNLKQELILKANKTPDFIENMEKYDPLNLIIEQISHDEALDIKETYSTVEVFFTSEDEYEEVRMLTTAFLCTQNGKYYEVKFFTSTVESDDMIKNMLYLLGILWFVFSIVLIIATQRIIYKSNQPFYTLLQKLEKFDLNESRIFDFPSTSISEYSDLNSSIKDLLEENINAYSEQKNFIENASHELQTPIAIAISKLELMMLDNNISQHQLEDINTVVNSLGRAKRLNSTLLLLSKIRNKQFSDSEMIDVIQIFDEILENFEAMIEYKQITLDIDQQGHPSVDMNKDLAFILVNNLVKNAIAHNIVGGKINIIYRDNSVVISNTGTSVPENVDIFERYISHTDSRQSSGLGLSIVKTIVDRYKMQIMHAYTNNIHTITLILK